MMMAAKQSADYTASLSLEISADNNSLNIAEIDTVIEMAVTAALSSGLPGPTCPMELYIELVGNEKSQGLNAEYREKDYATNVLSFPGTEKEELPAAMQFSLAGGPPVMLGDLIIASDVVKAEAASQGKPVEHHFIHLIVHGVLHLLGYDHIEETDANEMETLECKILEGLGISDPYEER